MTQPGLAAIHPAAKLSPAPAARPAACSHPPLSREADIFDEASALPLAGRAAFLDQACAGDSALRARVEGLLAGYAEMERALPAALVVRDIPRVEEQPGERIGRYKLLEKIGEGGCGVVWMAEQEEPVRRRVALKVIKLGMDTKAVVARFEAERQALARMEHPHIAKIFDAGATDTGRPYFVMELVRGVPITRFCDERKLPNAQRLALFIQVCHALQHAHEKGIIHRDIKPSNILVTLHDDAAVPKVIDFGIAKATQGRLTDATMFTAFEQFIGTPAYMSPEQAELSGLELDPRSDVYSLGVLLYELLTGRPPFDPKTLQQAGLDEVRRIIREVEPARPSTRLNTLAEAERTTLANLRGAAPAQLSTQLSGDLDWIVMKALEKDRMRRYASAGAFAADVKRHLNHEPIAARPPGTAYVFGKFLRRHRLPVAVSALVIVGMVASTAVSVGLLSRQKSSPTATTVSVPTTIVSEKSLAVLPIKNQSPDAQNAFFADGLHDDILSHLFNIRELIVRSSTSVEPYRTTAKGVKEIGAELGVAYLLEASVRRDGSKVHLNAQLIDARTDTPRWAKVFDRDLSDIFALQAELANAIAVELRTALTPQEKMRLEQKHTDNPVAFDLYLRARESFSFRASRGHTGDLARAETLYRAAVELDPKFASAWADLSRIHGFAYLQNSDHTPARLEQARTALDKAVKLDPTSPTAIWAQADFYYNVRDWARSLERYETLARLQPNNPDNVYWQWQIGVSCRRLSRWPEAVAALRRATEIDPNLQGPSALLVQTLEFGRRYSEADAEARRWLRAHPESLNERFGLARRAFYRGVPAAEAEKLIGPLTELQKNSPEGITLRKQWAYATGNLDEFIRLFRTNERTAPQNSPAYSEEIITPALALLVQGESEAARALFSDTSWMRKQLEADPKNEILWMALAKTEALLGNREEALRCLGRLRSDARGAFGGSGARVRAFVHAWTGNLDQAISEYAGLQGTPGTDVNVHFMRHAPEFAPLRGDPRFEALISDPKNNAPLF